MVTTATRLGFRWLRSTLLGDRSAQFTATEVRSLLSPDVPGSTQRRQATLATVAVTSAWLEYLGKREARELGRLAERLPSIVYLYAAGAALEEILRRVGGWSTWRVERALDAACACIAACLNEHPLPTGPIVSEDSRH